VFDTFKFEDFLVASQSLVAAARGARPAAVARSFYGTVPGYFSGETRDAQAPKLRDFGSILGRLKASAEPALAAAATRALDAAQAAKLAGAAGNGADGPAGYARVRGAHRVPVRSAGDGLPAPG
jgi:hypothetical protein